jgi:hypothetical protein
MSMKLLEVELEEVLCLDGAIRLADLAGNMVSRRPFGLVMEGAGNPAA